MKCRECGLLTDDPDPMERCDCDIPHGQIHLNPDAYVPFERPTARPDWWDKT